jgi:hypothetical protein
MVKVKLSLLFQDIHGNTGKPQHMMEVSGQHHALATAFPQKKPLAPNQ